MFAGPVFGDIVLDEAEEVRVIIGFDNGLRE